MSQFQLRREHHIPKGAAKVADKASSAVVYIYEAKGEPCAIAFHGKAQKPDWRYRFTSTARREERIRQFMQSIQAAEKRRAERRREQHKPHNLQLGHVLVASWGYDQTNVDFYQITALVSPTMVEIRPISATHTRHDGDRGTVVPAMDQFTGEARRVKVIRGSVKVGHTYARLWNGRPLYWSSYA